MSQTSPTNSFPQEPTSPPRLIRRVEPVESGQYIRREAGDQVSQRVVITEQMVKIYAALMDDQNPIHVDKETGKSSVFGGNIAHGMLTGGLFGPLIVNQLIGPGAVYVKQSLEFEAPVLVGEAVNAVITVEETKIRPGKDIYVLHTEGFLDNGKRVINGEAIILVPGQGN